MKNPSQPDTRYVDELISPDTVTTMPPTAIAAVVDHGTPRRTLDSRVAGAHDTFDRVPG